MAKERTKGRKLVGISIIDKLTDGFNDFNDAIVQMVENEEDWGAQTITIRFEHTTDGDVTNVTFIGDGVGIDSEGREAYRSVCESRAKGQEGKKGRNGTGRLGFVLHASMAITFTKTTGGRPFRIEMTRETMFEAWFGGGPDLEWEQLPRIPAGVPLKSSGVVTTWCNIGMGEGVAKQKRTAKRVISGLAEKLSPHVARKVTVEMWEDGKLVEGQKLKQREIEGNPIEGEHYKVPGIGDIKHWIFVVANPDRQYDQLMVGAIGPVCTWGEFSAMFRRDERYAEFMRGIDPVLGNPKTVGLLDFGSVLNEYAVNNRKGFNTNLLENEELCLALLGWLRRHLVPMVEKELGLRAEEIFTTDDHTLLAGICRDFQESTGEKPEKGRIIADIDLNRHRVDLEPGMEYIFVIRKPQEGVRYVWDKTNAGGSLDTTIGVRVKYKAQSLGKHTLVVREMGDASKDPVAEITINVVKRLPLGFTKPSITMSTHDRRTLQLQNTHNTSGDLEWVFENGWGCTTQVAEDLEECIVTSSDMEGTWDVTVRDRKAPDEIVAVCTITVKEGSNEHPEKRKASDTTFVYDGHTFELIGNHITGRSVEAVTRTSWLERGNAVSVITLNFGHPTIQPYKDAGRDALARREVYLRVAQHSNQSANPEEFINIAAIIGAKLVKGTK